MLANLLKKVCLEHSVWISRENHGEEIHNPKKEEEKIFHPIQDGDFKMAEESGNLFVRALSQQDHEDHLGQALGKVLPCFYWAAGQNVQNQHKLTKHYSEKQND